jgi:hypothetical protein
LHALEVRNSNLSSGANKVRADRGARLSAPPCRRKATATTRWTGRRTTRRNRSEVRVWSAGDASRPRLASRARARTRASFKNRSSLSVTRGSLDLGTPSIPLTHPFRASSDHLNRRRRRRGADDPRAHGPALVRAAPVAPAQPPEPPRALGAADAGARVRGRVPGPGAVAADGHAHGLSPGPVLAPGEADARPRASHAGLVQRYDRRPRRRSPRRSKTSNAFSATSSPDPRLTRKLPTKPPQEPPPRKRHCATTWAAGARVARPWWLAARPPRR